MPNPSSLNKPSASTPEASVPVWDVFIRVFHWALVVLMAIAAITGFLASATWINVHVIAGLGIGGLVLMRIVWGFTGSRHARFADFARAPSVVLDHARHLASGQAGRHLGHNPLGGIMVLTKPGKTRAGKPIEPLAPSANPKRLSDLVEVEKWLGRNCDSVLGRACSPTEKADVVAYLAGL